MHADEHHLLDDFIVLDNLVGDAGQGPPDVLPGHYDFGWHKITPCLSWQGVLLLWFCYFLTSLSGLA